MPGYVWQIAYGHRRDATSWQAATISTEHHRGYTGHEHLDNVGLIHMNGRVYDPENGRFISADPFVPRPNYSQSWNRYSYVLNNPLSFTDPSGFVEDSSISDTILVLGTPATTGFSFNSLTALDIFGSGAIPLPSFSPNVPRRGGDGEQTTTEATAAAADEAAAREAARRRAGQDNSASQGAGAHDVVGGDSNGLEGDKFSNGVSQAEEGADAIGDAIAAAAEAAMDLSGALDVADAALEAAAAAKNETGVSQALTSGAAGLITKKFGFLNKAGKKLFGKGGALNSNRHLRIGIGRKGRNRVFRITGDFIGNKKIDLFDFGPIQKTPTE